MKFRKDINGLRAIAVLAVVLFHFAVPHFQGGFVGVDVFFVISGYLMTDIIVRGFERGDFSVLAFYGFRARRIVPALAVLCLVLLGVGWLVLLPSEYRALGKEAAASVGFFSNITFWARGGLFRCALAGEMAAAYVVAIGGVAVLSALSAGNGHSQKMAAVRVVQTRSGDHRRHFLCAVRLFIASGSLAYRGVLFVADSRVGDACGRVGAGLSG
jgi:hypothetical protein